MASQLTYFRAAALLGSIVVSSPLILGFFGRVHPAFDSLAHFRAHLAVALVVCALVLLAVHLRWQALAAILLAAGALSTTWPGLSLQFPTAQAASSPGGAEPVYRLLQLNLRWNNPHSDRVLALIRKEQPDIITLNEFSPMWLEKLAVLDDAYPNRVICETKRHGSAILTRRPLAANAQKSCVSRGVLAMTTVDLDGREVGIGAIHLAWPWPRGQYRQIGWLSDDVATFGATAILAGDFNATTWSAALHRVADAGNFSIVRGIGPTWIHYGIARSLRWAGLPIDHVLVKGDIVPRNAQTLEDVGSDHWPVLLEFSLRQQPATVASR